ncbi:MAG: acyltransferase [Clostridiales bacterium]|nr:acyltransferase [Clostridiales bacterium]
MPEFLKDMTLWSILEQVVFYSFLILYFWGGNNRFGKKNEFNTDFTSLEAMKSLRGFAALGVLLHHISQEEIFQKKQVLSAFVNAGAYFVAIFFFCSGYGLIKSLNTKKDYLKGFIRHRIVKAIVIPFYVNVLIYGLAMFIFKYQMPPQQWICNLLGVTMMNVYAWFPIVLALLYLVFFLCFRFIKNRPVCFAVMLLFIIGMGIGFCYNGHFAWWSGKENWWLGPEAMNAKWWQGQKVFWFSGEWWVNSAPAFFTGLVFANYEKELTAFFSKLYALKFHILLILTMIAYKLSQFGQMKFGYWTEYSGMGPGTAEKIKTYFCQVPLFLLLGLTIIIFMMKYHVSNPVTRFFGKYSLHTYLMNLMALESLRFITMAPNFPIKTGIENRMFLYAVAVIALSVLLGVGEQKLTELIQKLLFGKKKDTVQKTA